MGGGEAGDDTSSCGSQEYLDLPEASDHGVPEPEGELVSVFCEASPNFRLMMRSDGAILAFKNLEDPKQQWIKIDMGHKFKDQEGARAFILLNKASGHALAHGDQLGDLVTGQIYDANSLENAILWSESKQVGKKDVGKGFSAIRLVTNINLHLDADHGSKKYGGIKDGNKLLLHTWNKQENQKWKIVPLDSSSDN